VADGRITVGIAVDNKLSRRIRQTATDLGFTLPVRPYISLSYDETEAWESHAAGGPEPYPTVVVHVAEKYRLDVADLMWQTEAERGVEAHDRGFDRAVIAAAIDLRKSREAS